MRSPIDVVVKDRPHPSEVDMNGRRIQSLLIVLVPLLTVGCWGGEKEKVIAYLKASEASLKAENAGLKREVRDLKDQLAEKARSKP